MEKNEEGEEEGERKRKLYDCDGRSGQNTHSMPYKRWASAIFFCFILRPTRSLCRFCLRRIFVCSYLQHPTILSISHFILYLCPQRCCCLVLFYSSIFLVATSLPWSGLPLFWKARPNWASIDCGRHKNSHTYSIRSLCVWFSVFSWEIMPRDYRHCCSKNRAECVHMCSHIGRRIYVRYQFKPPGRTNNCQTFLSSSLHLGIVCCQLRAHVNVWKVQLNVHNHGTTTWCCA